MQSKTNIQKVSQGLTNLIYHRAQHIVEGFKMRTLKQYLNSPKGMQKFTAKNSTHTHMYSFYVYMFHTVGVIKLES